MERFNWDSWDTLDERQDESGYRTDNECPPLGTDQVDDPSPPSVKKITDEAYRTKYRFGWYAPGSEEDMTKAKVCPRIESIVIVSSIELDHYIH